MSQKNLLQIASALLVVMAIGCGQPHYEFIKAKITAIEKESDSSVVVKFEVYFSGNAEDCRFWIVYDTQPGFSYNRALIARSHNGCDVMDFTEVSIDGIVRGKKYYYQLGEWGTWDLGGATADPVVTIGDQWEYVLN